MSAGSGGTVAWRDVFVPSDADAALAAARDHLVVIYKHSPACDLSAMAYDEMQAFLRGAPAGLDVRIVDVLSARPASQRIEAATGVRHESPQVLLLAHGEVVWHASHRRVTASAVAEAVKAASAAAA